MTRAIPRPPRLVTVDCWSTLIEDSALAAALDIRSDALAGIAARGGVDISHPQAQSLIEQAWRRHVAEWRSGRVYGPRGAAAWCLGALGISGARGLLHDLEEAISEGSASAGVRPVEGAAQALATLRAGGVTTALLCDTGFTPGRVVRRLMSELGLATDHAFFSDEIGHPKPHPQIFLAALSASGAPAQEAVHIGDLRRTDIAGARAAGLASIRFTGVHDDAWAAEEAMGEEADAILSSWAGLGRLVGL